MSTSDGDTTSRLSDALDEVFEQAPPTLPPREPPTSNDVWHDDRTDSPRPTEPIPQADSEIVDERDGEAPYELPEIVPATPDSEPSAPAPTDPPVPPAPDVVAPEAPVRAPSTEPPTTGWSDHMAHGSPGTGPTLRAPGRRPRVRRVTRVLRHIDPWSTFKVALLFSAVTYVVFLTAGVLLWRVADNTGTLDNVERWFTQFGWETFELKGGEIFHNAWIIGLFGVVAATGGLVLLVTLFNLVSDIIGGVRMTVLEEEVVEHTVSSTQRYVVRRPTSVGDADPATQDWDVDGDDPVPESAAPAAEWDLDDDAPDADWSVDDDDTDDVEHPSPAG